jgi:hypothetical protein
LWTNDHGLFLALTVVSAGSAVLSPSRRSMLISLLKSDDRKVWL